jgi:lysine biosynthesis protein LysW
MTSGRKKVVAACLDCDNPIELSLRPVTGQIINCPHCRAELEIVSDNPLELDFYYEGDWDDDNS